jgi:hypothetical protein
MSEQNTTTTTTGGTTPSGTTTTTSATTAKAKQPRSLLNQRQISDLNKAGNIAHAAQQAGRATALADRDITSADVQALSDAVLAATQKAGAAVDTTIAKQNATGAENLAQNTLLGILADIQKAAKQKYTGDKISLAAYYVGQNLHRNRPQLETASQAILDKLSKDTLPGIKPANITALTTARQAYVDASTAQTGQQSSATTARKELESMLADVHTKRLKIQYAADAVWPHTDPTNAGVRKEFELVSTRPLK